MLMKKKFWLAMLGGAVLGMMFAKRPGKELRNDLTRASKRNGWQGGLKQLGKEITEVGDELLDTAKRIESSPKTRRSLKRAKQELRRIAREGRRVARQNGFDDDL